MMLIYPYFLLLFVPLLAFWVALAYVQKKEIFSEAVRERLSTFQGTKSYSIYRYSWLIIFYLMIFSLCRPVWLAESHEDKQKMKMGYLAISLDVSKSMMAEDVSPDRFVFSKLAINEIIKKMPDFRIALNAFSRDIFLVAPFSDDHETVRFLLDNLSQEGVSSEGSSVAAVMMGAEKIYRPFKREIKDVLIVTDGADGLEIKESIAAARKDNIRVHLLLVGTKEGARIRQDTGAYITDKHNQEVITKRADEMSALSEATGGVFIATTGSMSEIGWLCEQIRQKAQRDETEMKQKKDAKEFFYIPLAMALVLLFFVLNRLHVKGFAKAGLLLFLVIAPEGLHSGAFDFWDIIKSEEFYNRHRHGEALKHYIKVHESKNSDISAYNLATSYYRNENFEKAAELYNEINSTNPTVNYERLHNLGNTYVKLGKVPEAIKAYEDALLVKEDPATRFNLDVIKKFEEKESANTDESKKDDKKDKKENQKSKKSQKDKEEEEEEDNSDSGAKPPMEEKEAEKWERTLNTAKPKTKPQALIKNDQVEASREIHW